MAEVADYIDLPVPGSRIGDTERRQPHQLILLLTNAYDRPDKMPHEDDRMVKNVTEAGLWYVRGRPGS